MKKTPKTLQTITVYKQDVTKYVRQDEPLLSNTIRVKGQRFIAEQHAKTTKECNVREFSIRRKSAVIVQTKREKQEQKVMVISKGKPDEEQQQVLDIPLDDEDEICGYKCARFVKPVVIIRGDKAPVEDKGKKEEKGEKMEEKTDKKEETIKKKEDEKKKEDKPEPK